MTGAMILFGSSLFFLYALPRNGEAAAHSLKWPRPLILLAAAGLLVACVLGLLSQTVVLAGSMQEGLTYDALSAVVTGMSFGKSSCARALVAAVFFIAFALRKSDRRGWWLGVIAGGLICASFAWMGHGAATKGAPGLLHLGSDILHTLAAAVWIGALVAFLILLAGGDRGTDARRQALHRALHGFSGVGSGLVAVLVATGLINSWFLVGLEGLAGLWTSAYGQLLTLKLVLFLAMVGLAGANRFQLTPRLGAALGGGSSAQQAIAALRKSLIWETGISMAVLGIVAWFAMLAPPSAA